MGVSEGVGLGRRARLVFGRVVEVAWAGVAGERVGEMANEPPGRVASEAGISIRLHACNSIKETHAKTRLLPTDGVYHKNSAGIKNKLTPSEYALTRNLIRRFTGKIAQYMPLEICMRKSFLLLLTLATLVLAGCLPQATASPTPTATSAPTTASRPAPTVVLSIPEETPILPDSGCTVITQKPTPGPTATSIFPPVSTTDWVKGPADARVTIIEYSDFQ